MNPPAAAPRVREMFEMLADLTPNEVERELEQVAADDAALADQVRALLEADRASRDTTVIQRRLNVSLADRLDSGSSTTAVLPPGTEIGGYTIVEVIGEGGMGAVYKAEQDKPRRLVALKIIRPGLMTHVMLRRFEYEADVLGRLDHPGVATIHEAGIADTPLGRQPFFAMELVEGRRLDEYAAEQKLTTKGRLKLLVAICQAVHHAHTKGVIHRDLKPSNILITSDGQPKVLDFGVARATDSDVQSATLHTESGQLVGTLPYMAPEQAAGRVRELDTSSDVYALGVIAYELLSGGRHPYALEDVPLHEAVRIICDAEPLRLSSIDKSLRGDVETIVQKALDKDKSRRYHTAGELATEIKHYLNYEPITARPPSTWYSLRKFARRNKALVGGAAAVFIVLVAGVIGTTTFAIRADRQRAEAERGQRQTEAVVGFLTRDVFANASPQHLPDKAIRDVIVARMIDPAMNRIDGQFRDDPLTAATVKDSLATVLHLLGRSAEAEALASDALARRRQELGADHPDTLMSMCNLGSLMAAQGRFAEAEPLLREALQRRQRVRGDDHSDTLASMNNLAWVLRAQGRFTEAEPLAREGVVRQRRLLGNDHPDTLRCIDNLATVLREVGRLAEAEALFREGIEGCRRVLGEDHPDTLIAINNTGALLEAQGKLAEAESLYRRAMEGFRRILGEDHPDTLASMNNLAGALDGQGRFADAEPLRSEVLRRARVVLGETHPGTLTSIVNMGYVIQAQGRFAEAEPFTREALDVHRRTLGNDHPDTLRCIDNLANLLQKQGKPGDAEPLLAELYRRTQTVDMDPAWAARYISRYGPLLVKLGRHAEAAEPLRVAYDRLKATGQQTHPQFGAVLEGLAAAAEAAGQPDEASKWRAELAALAPAGTANTAAASLPTGGRASTVK